MTSVGNIQTMQGSNPPKVFIVKDLTKVCNNALYNGVLPFIVDPKIIAARVCDFIINMININMVKTKLHQVYDRM